MTRVPKGVITSLIPVDRIEHSILFIRGQKVMLDSDLATIYGVLTERLNEQMRRNQERFPADFAFQLTVAEYASLLPQIAGTKKGRGGRRSPQPGCYNMRELRGGRSVLCTTG